MKQNIQSTKYVIWLYDVTAKEYKIISENFPENLYEIKDIGNDFSYFKNIDNLQIFDKPDIVICDNRSMINNNITSMLLKNHSALIKVTTQKQITNNDLDVLDNRTSGYFFELNDEEIVERVKDEKTRQYITRETTKLEKSIKQINVAIQISQEYKWKYINVLLAKELRKDSNIDNELKLGKSLGYVSKQYLFKLARALNDIISFKDNYTSEHCDRVASYAEALGHAINMSNEDIEDLILAAYLHDIGKIAIPDAVITKTEKLNDLEFELMKKHTQIGGTILPGEQLGYLKEAVEGHHERYDGTGYPKGLKGEQISKFAQILAIADSFDAMTSQRTYNKVKSAEEAFEDLRRHTKPYGDGDGLGVFYNPKLVEPFIKVISNSQTMMEKLAQSKTIADIKYKEQEKLNQQKQETDKKLTKTGGMFHE